MLSLDTALRWGVVEHDNLTFSKQGLGVALHCELIFVDIQTTYIYFQDLSTSSYREGSFFSLKKAPFLFNRKCDYSDTDDWNQKKVASLMSVDDNVLFLRNMLIIS